MVAPPLDLVSMSGADEFRPRLGRIRDVGAGSSRKVRAQLRKAAAKLGQSGSKSGYRGTRIGAGRGALTRRIGGHRGMGAQSQRRVMVKVHIARAGQGGGIGAFKQHLKYIQRDGVDRDGAGGQLYGRDGDIAEGSAFADRSTDDRHQFRIIVSPEDSHAIEDLRITTRAFMAQVEKDLGTPLDWVAVDHHNTGHSHTHIVVRGRDASGNDLVIAKDYLTRGLRERARQIVTDELGPRRGLDIANAEQLEVGKDRFTGIDREIQQDVIDGQIEIGGAATERERFRRGLKLQRLKHLQGLHLAIPLDANHWGLADGWDATLISMGRRGDIVRSLAASHGKSPNIENVHLFSEHTDSTKPVLGIVLSQGPEDELRDKRFLLVEDMRGGVWHVSAGSIEHGAVPPIGAVVELSRREAEPKAADRTIAEIAARYRGRYSPEFHLKDDPAAKPAYIEAHKRRLEALRRAGIVDRSSEGIWTIDNNYLTRAAGFEAAKGGSVTITVKSWMTLERQTQARGVTWLDSARADAALSGSNRFRTAQSQRLTYLREQGLLASGETKMSTAAQQALRLNELETVAAREAARSGRIYAKLENGARFDGRFEKIADLGQGRMAVFGNDKQFTLAAWRPALERHRGRSMTIQLGQKAISWTFSRGRTRGFSR